MILAGLSFLLLFIGLYGIWRTSQVAIFLDRLLDEEANWLNSQSVEWLTEHFPDDTGFARYSSLPSFDTMLYKFWIPLTRYRKNLKPLADYYPGMDYQI